jgi:hypothetical protein
VVIRQARCNIIGRCGGEEEDVGKEEAVEVEGE